MSIKKALLSTAMLALFDYTNSKKGNGVHLKTPLNKKQKKARAAAKAAKKSRKRNRR